MSVSSEVQRTLVKSPPELWTELSDPATLARHLGELGEIRIVRTEPDRAVDWEATAADGARASGRVEIEPSGWGTRVTLTASLAVVAPAPQAEPAPEAEPTPVAEPAAAPAPEAEVMEVAVDPGPSEIESDPEPAPEPEIAEPAPRRRFFARLFRRRGRAEPESAVVLEPEPEPGAEIESDPAAEPAPEPEPIAEAEPATEPEPEEPTPEPDISAELAELEEQTTAVLTGVLDRLGAAHHRPFSRA
jgi:hypothetical protein